eukprot:CFRG8427T1
MICVLSLIVANVIIDDKQRYQITCIPGRNSYALSVDQELYLNDRTVIWSSGGAIKRCYTGDCRVREAVWTLMKLDTGGAPEPTLTVLQTEFITFTSLSGRMYTMPLGFSCKRIFAAYKHGFIMNVSDRKKSNGRDAVAPCEVWFGTHAWSTPRLVIFETDAGSPYTSTQMTCLFSESSSEFVVCLDRKGCAITIWRAKTAESSENMEHIKPEYSSKDASELDTSRSYTGAFADDVMNMAKENSLEVKDNGITLTLTLALSVNLGTITADDTNTSSWNIFVCRDCVNEPVTMWLVHKCSHRAVVVDLFNSASPTRTIVVNDACEIRYNSTENDFDDDVLALIDGSIYLFTAHGDCISQCHTNTIFVDTKTFKDPQTSTTAEKRLEVERSDTSNDSSTACEGIHRCGDNESEIREHDTQSIVGLQHSVGNRVTLCLSSGDMYRVAVSECAQTPVVRCIMRVLQVCLDLKETQQDAISVALTQTTFRITPPNGQMKSLFLEFRRCYLSEYQPSTEWVSFVKAILFVMNGCNSTTHKYASAGSMTISPNIKASVAPTREMNATADKTDNLSAWEYLCAQEMKPNTQTSSTRKSYGYAGESGDINFTGLSMVDDSELSKAGMNVRVNDQARNIFSLLDVCAACLSIDMRFRTHLPALESFLNNLVEKSRVINNTSSRWCRGAGDNVCDDLNVNRYSEVKRLDIMHWLECTLSQSQSRTSFSSHTNPYHNARERKLPERFPFNMPDRCSRLPQPVLTAMVVTDVYSIIGARWRGRGRGGASEETNSSTIKNSTLDQHTHLHKQGSVEDKSTTKYCDLGLTQPKDNKGWMTRSDFKNVVRMLSSLHISTLAQDPKSVQQLGNVSQFSMDHLMHGVALPLRECVAALREQPDITLSSDTCRLIGREDLIENRTPILHTLDGVASLKSRLTYDDVLSPPPTTNGFIDKSDLDTLAVNGVWRYCFIQDRRFMDALRMLQSNAPVIVQIPADRSTPEYDATYEKQRLLLDNLEQTLSRSVGRGMALYGSTRPLITEPLRVPPISTKGQDYQTRATLTLDPSIFPFVVSPETPAGANGTVTDTSGFTTWPEFHNGSAAGLAIAVTGSVRDISSAWIAYNRPVTSSKSPGAETSVTENTYAGFLLALGLQGHLSHLSRPSLYRFLRGRHTTTSVAVVLGMAAACRGTQDATVTSLLACFVPALLPPQSAELEAPEAVRTASVLGLGLLYLGTAQRQMCKILLQEIGRGPGSSYSGANNGYDNRSINSDSIKNASSYSLACGLALGMCALGLGDEYENINALGDFNLPDELRRYMHGGKLRLSEFRGEKDFRLKEGNRINTDITAHAATIALGLIYLKTGNTAISSRLEIPSTYHQLDYVRSDLLLLRVLSRCLILWDTIRPTKAWVTSHVPTAITETLSGADDSNGKGMSVDTSRLSVAKQVQMYVIAGACFAIGLKYAGSSDKMAQDCLKDFGIMLLSQRPSEYDRGSSMTTSCALVCMNALCMTMAGTGDLDTMRFILRFRKDMHRNYGSSMAVNMGLGLLFLGSGMYSLSTKNEGIAALICAFYPMFPDNPADNRYHLQAFRHLYVLALESRTVIPRETCSGLPVSIPLRINLRDGTDRTVIAPCVLPELSFIRSISVNSPRYWPIKIVVTPRTSLVRLCALVVKRKTGYLPYRDDPNGIRRLSESVNFSSFEASTVSDVQSHDRAHRAQLMRMVRAYTLDATLLAYAESMLGRAAENDFFVAILFECLVSGTPEMLATYIKLNHTLKNVSVNPNVLDLRNLRLIQTFYSSRQERIKSPLLLQSFLDDLHQRISSVLLNSNPSLTADQLQNIRCNYFFGGEISSASDLESFMRAHDEHTKNGLSRIAVMSRLASQFSAVSPNNLLSVMNNVTGIPML